jgi:hypothetical protein
MSLPGDGGGSGGRSKRARKRKRFADEEPEESGGIGIGCSPLVLLPATAGGGPESLATATPDAAGKPTTASTPGRMIRVTRESVPGSSKAAVRRNPILSSKKLPLQRSRHRPVSFPAAASLSSPSVIVSPVKKSSRLRQVSGTAGAVQEPKIDARIVIAGRVKGLEKSHPTPPVIELGGPSNNNSDKALSSAVTPAGGCSAERKRTHHNTTAEEKSPPLPQSGGVSNGESCGGDERYPYLRFDFSLPPCELARNLVEGVNVPGCARPILMQAPKLPPGWTKKVTVRQGS